MVSSGILSSAVFNQVAEACVVCSCVVFQVTFNAFTSSNVGPSKDIYVVYNQAIFKCPSQFLNCSTGGFDCLL